MAVLGTTGPGARGPGPKSFAGPLSENFFVNQGYSSSSFSLKFLCLKDAIRCFPVISFQFFLVAGPLLGYQKSGAWGRGPPGSP